MVLEWLLNNPEIGWVGVFLYIFWEIRGPNGKVKEITESIRSITVVVRALARANTKIDTKEVDSYLTDENGSEPGDFIDFEQEHTNNNQHENGSD